MSETIAITGKSVKLFKGHYTSWSGAKSPAGERGFRDLLSALLSRPLE
ncbi:MAG: hypothetical protein ACREYE_00890 [Gammaproteobacteria bacterium]